ncbi:3-hydroxyacyl-[acyl-carrier-protein] dehydratase FabZ [Candidatus Methylomirabilis limnetica]|uniref:3-hydroxyacyl-[acyl-carrier-protein] dehydratase FabZ n=1 Tax=Candidatus Methylomirabilis limnetica TaxID=2033718 RepID=A0A2T4TY18_9BACT|nr:3-hydroxyacyl-ACP dehydratase FabZ [Candidatus Methylomirabilis limnetica]PTL35990.1 3-hydroxyacyl-[acyl-carrier-protein] dehydratase FabZ [Candidatus Methylomirabilis limnetica]
MIDSRQIQDMLPHRYPFLLVDRILEIEPGKRVVGLKNVTINEAFFQGHFPGQPIMPGVLVIEAMAQVGGILLMRTLNVSAEKKLLYLAGIDRARFRRPVLPGDQVRLEVELIQLRSRTCRMRASAMVDGKLAVEAELSCIVVDRGSPNLPPGVPVAMGEQ